MNRKYERDEHEEEISISKYAGYSEISKGVYTPTPSRNLIETLPSAAYKLGQDANSGALIIREFKLVSDQIIDIPSPEFKTVVDETTHFLTPSTEDRFNELGYLYKRSFLLHGAPGVGKTVIVNRVAQEVIKNGGLVIFNPDPDLLAFSFEAFSTTSERLVMVIFEELEEILDNKEDTMLSLLDGEIQKPRVIYCATTNHIDQIPKRILRPGRFSTVLEVGYPNIECRSHYLNTKLKDKEQVELYAKVTEGLSIDELKELVLQTQCFGYPVEKAIDRIVSTRDAGSSLKVKANTSNYRVYV